MSLSLVIVLIIVVWLIVLAPLLLRGQRPIHKAGEAYDETRVLHEGGSGRLASRRAPKVKATDVREHRGQEDDDYEVVVAETGDDLDEDELLIDEPLRRSAPHTTSAAVVDGEIVAADDERANGESMATDAGSAEGAVPVDADGVGGSTAVSRLDGMDGAGDADNADGAPSAEAADVEELRGGQYAVDESFTGAGDLLHPYARAEASDEYAAAKPDTGGSTRATEAGAEDAELDEEDVAFAKSRTGRGGWDPERDKQTTLDRYARRRRTLLGLGVVVAVAVVIGLFVGGWTWLLTVAALAVTALYLTALRAQVRSERELRARRVRHLRRARLGVRQSGVPKNLRRPGAVVMEIDDDSPDFAELPSARYSEFVEGDPPAPTPSTPRTRFPAAG